MADTLDQLVQKVVRRLSLVDGTGVQLYAEDLIADQIQHKFNIAFEEAYWPQFSGWLQCTLDGTLGVSTTDLDTYIKRFGDIGAIFPENSNTALTKLDKNVNPFTLSGTSPMHYAPYNADEKKVFQVWPRTATGTLTVYYRTKPANFTPSDEVDFDEDYLILGACYDMLEDDGSNPGTTAKFQALFESRRKQIMDTYNDDPIALDPVTARPQTFTFVELP